MDDMRGCYAAIVHMSTQKVLMDDEGKRGEAVQNLAQTVEIANGETGTSIDDPLATGSDLTRGRRAPCLLDYPGGVGVAGRTRDCRRDGSRAL